MPRNARPKGVDARAYTRLMRTRYGTENDHGNPARPHFVALQGGPYDGGRLNMHDPFSGTLVMRVGAQVGRYAYVDAGYHRGEPNGYLQWHEAAR